MEGTILLNGHPKQEETFSRVACYVEQQDIHMPFATVRESLQFSARLRLSAEVTDEQREAFIDEVYTMPPFAYFHIFRPLFFKVF